MADKREGQSVQLPQPGYAATLMGDDTAKVMSPLLTVMTATAALNVFDMLAPQIGLGMTPGGLAGASLKSPILGMARNSMSAPVISSPLTGGPKF